MRIKIPLPWKSRSWSPNDDTIRYGRRSLYVHIRTELGYFHFAAGVGFSE